MIAGPSPAPRTQPSHHAAAAVSEALTHSGSSPGNPHACRATQNDIDMACVACGTRTASHSQSRAMQHSGSLCQHPDSPTDAVHDSLPAGSGSLSDAVLHGSCRSGHTSACRALCEAFECNQSDDELSLADCIAAFCPLDAPGAFSAVLPAISSLMRVSKRDPVNSPEYWSLSICSRTLRTSRSLGFSTGNIGKATSQSKITQQHTRIGNLLSNRTITHLHASRISIPAGNCSRIASQDPFTSCTY